MRRLYLTIILVNVSFLTWTVSNLIAATPGNWTLKAKVDNRWIEGKPLAWSIREVNVLGRDGRLWTFNPKKATDFKKISSSFQPYSTMQMKGVLLREFGKGFEVSATGHYLVVHPTGQRDYWAARFEQLYRNFSHYFSVRGFRVQRPKFPLVAIVFPTQQQMMRYANKEGTRISRNVLGYYSPKTNRVTLYDRSGGKASKKQWQENSDTIIHEAAHQTAFNTGIHSRFGMPPHWVAEGIGTLFEARGVWDSHQYKLRRDRINQGRLADFQKSVAPKLKPEVLVDFIATDRMFRTNPGAAYATAWSLSFYLIETQPRKYFQYLRKTAQRKPFEPYTRIQRMQDFTSVFGKDFKMLNARFVRFMKDVTAK